MQIFGDRERWFHSVLVAEIMRLFGDAQLGIATFEPKPTAGRADEATDDPQERRLARAIAAGHGQSLAVSQLETDAGKDVPPAAAAG